jgi:hypothetical protein
MILLECHESLAGLITVIHKTIAFLGKTHTLKKIP